MSHFTVSVCEFLFGGRGGINRNDAVEIDTERSLVDYGMTFGDGNLFGARGGASVEPRDGAVRTLPRNYWPRENATSALFAPVPVAATTN